MLPSSERFPLDHDEFVSLVKSTSTSTFVARGLFSLKSLLSLFST